MRLFTVAIAIFIFTHQAKAEKKIDILACSPHWAAMAKSIGGDKVNVKSILSAKDNPHHYTIKRSDIDNAKNTDLLVCTGSALEARWIDELVKKSGNTSLNDDFKSKFMASEHVPLLNSRSQKGNHPRGNPHIHLNPAMMVRIGRVFKGHLADLDPENSQVYKENLLAYTHFLQTTIYQWQKRIANLNGKYLMSHHDNWSYLAVWLKMRILTTVEEYPGKTGSKVYQDELVNDLNIMKPDLCVKSDNEDTEAIKKISAAANIECITLPYTLNEWDDQMALSNWYEGILKTVVGATQQQITLK